MSRSIPLRSTIGIHCFVIALAASLIQSPVIRAQSIAAPNQSKEIQFPSAAPCNDNLQACIDQAADGATIQIAAGIYTVSLSLTHPVSLIGVSADTTILNAEPNRRVLLIQGAAIDERVTIANLTIRGGHADGGNTIDHYGGGIFITDQAAPQLRNLIVRDNFAKGYGGGIAIFDAARITIQNSVITNNTSEDNGGGLCSNAQYTVIESTEISGNHGIHGGGAFIGKQFEMHNVQITQNQAQELGGGLYGGNSESTMNPLFSWLLDSHIADNNAGYEGGGAYLFNTLLNHDHFEQNKVSLTDELVGGGGGLAAMGIVTVTKTVFANNEAPDGGGIASLGGKMWVQNSLFVDNQIITSQADGQAALQGGAAVSMVDANTMTDLYLTHLTIADRDTNPAAALKTGNGEIRMSNSIVVNHAVALYNSGGKISEESNLYFGNGQTIEGATKRSDGAIYADPEFEDIGALNFHLLTTSPAIDAGKNVNVLDDIDEQTRPAGGAPDIGYDESMSKPIIPNQPIAPPTNGVYLPLVVR